MHSRTTDTCSWTSPSFLFAELLPQDRVYSFSDDPTDAIHFHKLFDVRVRDALDAVEPLEQSLCQCSGHVRKSLDHEHLSGGDIERRLHPRPLLGLLRALLFEERLDR